MPTKKKAAPKKAAPKKAAVKQAVAKKTAAKKSAVKKTAVKKAPPKKAAVKKTAAKKAPPKKAAVKKTAAKKVSPKKTAVKRAVAKKTAAKKSAGTKPSPKQASSPGVTWEELYRMEIVTRSRSWNRERDVDSIEGINRRLAFGGYGEVIRDVNRAYEGAIWKIAGEILSHRDRIRLVIVAGPSSSGKTTTTMKICEALRTAGEKLQLLALDNYFWNLKDQPRDEYGDYDFETPGALDIATINRNLKDLLAGKETVVPVYNFKTGRREETGKTMQLAPGEILVVEGLHGLHDQVTRGVPRKSQFRVYIEAICQLTGSDGNFVPWTDIRLLRRMVRDNLHRNYSPEMTVGHWHYVRDSEKKYIVPFIKEADAVINGYLPYELPVHKKYTYESLRRAVEAFAASPGREDAHARARRCLDWLEQVDVLEDDSVIPADSLLREFIGGSVYEY
ncbi:MAG TPA: nucleoside kinase [bacterium]|nr:nucleoside kinase [bacterium]